MNKGKLNPSLTQKVLEVKLTVLESALIKKIRELDYGQYTLVVHKIEGQPVRMEITQINASVVLEARDGLELEDATYIADRNNLRRSY